MAGMDATPTWHSFARGIRIRPSRSRPPARCSVWSSLFILMRVAVMCAAKLCAHCSHPSVAAPFCAILLSGPVRPDASRQHINSTSRRCLLHRTLNRLSVMPDSNRLLLADDHGQPRVVRDTDDRGKMSKLYRSHLRADTHKHQRATQQADVRSYALDTSLRTRNVCYLRSRALDVAVAVRLAVRLAVTLEVWCGSYQAASMSMASAASVAGSSGTKSGIATSALWSMAKSMLATSRISRVSRQRSGGAIGS